MIAKKGIIQQVFYCCFKLVFIHFFAFSLSSFTAFMKDPAGDAPWEEDDASKDVVHIPSPQALSKFLQKEKKSTMYNPFFFSLFLLIFKNYKLIINSTNFSIYL